MEIGIRITEARERRGLKKADLARALGVKPVNVTQWEAGTTRPDLARVPDIARALQVTVGWLMGEDERNINLETGIFSAHAGPQFVPGVRDFPVLGSAEAGDGTFTMDSGVPIDFVNRPIGLANRKDAYGIYVQGVSMLPIYDPGDLVYVDPRRPPMIGRDCIVQLKKRSEGDAMRFLLKRLVKRTGAKWTFRQFNPEKDIVLDDREIQAVHLILKNHEMLRS